MGLGSFGSGDAARQAATQWAGQNGITYDGSDVINLPNGGGMIDIIGNFGGGAGNGQPMNANWTPAGGNGPNPGSGPGSAGYQAPTAPQGMGATASMLGQAGAGQVGVDPQFREALLRLMGRAEQPVGDMSGDPRAAAYQRARLLGAQRERGALAERAAYTGLNSGGAGSGAFETGIQGIQEAAGEDIAGQQAGLVGEEMQARRDDLQRALSIASSVGARDQEAQLRMQLANMDEAFRRAQLGQQGSQFQQQLGQQGSQWDDQYGLNRQALQRGLNNDIFGAF